MADLLSEILNLIPLTSIKQICKVIWSLNGLCVCHNNNRAYKTDNPKRNVCQAGMPKSVSQHHIFLLRPMSHTLVRSDSALCALLAFEEHSDVDLL